MTSTFDVNYKRGDYLMTIISVMGTALAKAHRLSNTRRGAVLILDEKLSKQSLPDGVEFKGAAGNCIDWISSDLALSRQIANDAGLETANPQALIGMLNLYCELGLRRLGPQSQ